MIPTVKPSAGLTNVEGKSKITPALCLKETISLRHSMTQVVIIPAMPYAMIVPTPPQSVIMTPVLMKSPMPTVPDTAIPVFQLS